jgi:phosphatidylserine/phosphatidylglycerophosphate/cardiolipin synthase-like enzyme
MWDSLWSPGQSAAAAVSEPTGGATSIEAGFAPGNAEGMVVRAIDQAHGQILVAAYSFTSRPIAQALIRAKHRGVQVMAVLDKSQRTERYSSAHFLANSGVPVRIDSRYAIMHNKFLVIDGQTVETGSFNYTFAAARRNAENVLIVRYDKPLAQTYAREWNRLWGESQPLLANY